jgi:hypothetical protein
VPALVVALTIMSTTVLGFLNLKLVSSSSSVSSPVVPLDSTSKQLAHNELVWAGCL